MKPTQEQVIAWAREAGFEDYHWTSLSGNSELDRTLQVGEYPVGESVFAIATIAYEAGRKDERERILDMCKEGLWDGGGIKFHLDKQGENNEQT